MLIHKYVDADVDALPPSLIGQKQGRYVSLVMFHLSGCWYVLWFEHLLGSMPRRGLIWVGSFVLLFLRFTSAAAVTYVLQVLVEAGDGPPNGGDASDVTPLKEWVTYNLGQVGVGGG